MSFMIDVLDETDCLTDDQRRLVRVLIESALRLELEEEDAELSVTFVDNETIRKINKEYRNKDYATDVISFALSEGEEPERMPGMPLFLGDLVISYSKAEEQAKEYGHSLERELGFLAVHGVLHLLGYIHDEPEQEKQMFTRQEEILKAYGLTR